MGEEEHESEENCDNPGAGVDFLCLACEELDGNVGDKTESDTVGNVVGEGHHGNGQESGNGDGRVIPVNVLYTADHKNTYIDKGCCISCCGNEGSNGHCIH